MQTLSYNPLLGFLFSMLAAIAWGTVPIAIKEVLTTMDPDTLICYRFIVATVGLYILLKIKHRNNKIIDRKILTFRYLALIMIGVGGLTLNFVTFTSSIQYVESEVAQLISQLAPYLMMLLSYFILKEKIYHYQKVGAVIMIFGMLLFFNEKFVLFTADGVSGPNYLYGFMLALLAPFVWSIYGITQKVLLKYFGAQEILLIFYFCGSFLFMPLADFSQVKELSVLSWVMFIYACINTIFGYGSYAEALARWDTAKVSAIVSLAPLFTILFSLLANYSMPEYFTSMHLNMLGYIGAIIVVLGVICTAIGHKLIVNRIDS